MPLIGEIKRGRDIGKIKSQRSAFIWQACPDCEKERWVQLRRKSQPTCLRCKSCSAKGHKVTVETRKKHSLCHRGQNSHLWKGGRFKTKQGYIFILVQPDDFFAPMRNASGYVREHRLVVAKALGRCLQSWELVHHKGAKYPKGSIENRQDNRYPENLQLVTDERHNQITIMERRITYLEKRITLLEAENILLRTNDELEMKA